MRNSLDDDKREQMKESGKIRKKEMCNNLDGDKIEQIRYNDKDRKRTNMQKLKMKENRFLIMSIDAVWFIHLFLQHQHSK